MNKTKKINNHLPDNLRNFKTIKERRQFIEKKLEIKLQNIGCYSVDENVASTRNCENMIGVTQVPLGIAGPIRIMNHESRIMNYEGYFIPLATTEGALVASVNRGCKAATLSGGVYAHTDKIGVTRGPVFKVKSIKESERLSLWLRKNQTAITSAAQSISHHLIYKKHDLTSIGNYVYIRFYFDSSEAMGMNMATIATEKIASLIKEETGISCLSLSGNFCVDKKPAWQNFLNKRGFEVKAEAVIKERIIKEVLKTKAKQIYDVWLGKCMIGSAISGSMGFNAQYANVVAAIFLACGQDIAHVVEGSLGITTTETLSNGDLYISVYLPALMVGVIGGGTTLGTQKEALQILGIDSAKNGENSQKLAEIIGGVVLAGELSLLASLAQGSLAGAHQRLGRGTIK